MRLKIEKLVYGGSGLARSEEGVVFVPRTAPGDVIEARVVEKKKDYSVARMTELLEPSPDRQHALCAAGCCHWQHIRYERQLQIKEEILPAFARAGILDKVRFLDEPPRLQHFMLTDGGRCRRAWIERSACGACRANVRGAGGSPA